MRSKILLRIRDSENEDRFQNVIGLIKADKEGFLGGEI
jgi:hypothetical protein